MEKRRSIGVTIFGWVFILLGLLILFASLFPLGLYFKFKNILSILSTVMEYFSYWKYLMLSAAPLGMIWSLIYIICGIGLLRLKFWARYIIIVLMLTSIITPLNKALIFGSQTLNIIGLLLQIVFVSFILWFFMKEKVKKQFEVEGVKFRLKSKYGAIIGLIIFLTLFTPVTVLTFKVYALLKYKEPFFIAKPQVIRLQKAEDEALLEKYRRIELFGASLLIPKDFAIIGFSKPPDNLSEWIAFIANPVDSKKGLVSLSSKVIYETTAEMYRVMGFKNAYDFEQAILTNNWSPIFITLRNVIRPRGKVFKIEQINSPKLKGFIRSSYNKEQNHWIYEVSFYSKDTLASKGMMIMVNEEYLNRKDALNIISSFTLLEEKERGEDKYYKEGLKSLNSNDFIDAQFKFANAYYLSPENPEYGYMLAKALFKNGRKSFYSVKRILEEVLKLEPDYKEARELLETIKLELSSASSSGSK